MADKLFYFKWNPSEAMADLRYSSMSDAELGFYHRCLNFAWTNDGIPADPEQLARAMKVTSKYLKGIWPRVGRCFSADPDRPDVLVNPRQHIERKGAVSKSEANKAAAGRRWGGQRKQGTRPDRVAPMQCDLNANALHSKEVRNEECNPTRVLAMTMNTSVEDPEDVFVELSPPPMPFPNPVPSVISELYDQFHELLRRWPGEKRVGVDLGCQTWITHVDNGVITMANLQGVWDGLDRWKASQQWNEPRYIHSLATMDGKGWLQVKAWLDFPAPLASIPKEARTPYKRFNAAEDLS